MKRISLTLLAFLPLSSAGASPTAADIATPVRDWRLPAASRSTANRRDAQRLRPAQAWTISRLAHDRAK